MLNKEDTLALILMSFVKIKTMNQSLIVKLKLSYLITKVLNVESLIDTMDKMCFKGTVDGYLYLSI